MSLEDDLSNLNEFYFFKEFTYTKNLFKRKDGQEIEVADNILAISDLYIIFQLKERKEVTNSTPEKEKKWFSKKVLKKATKQIRDTIGYFDNYDEVRLSNNQAHSFNLATSQISFFHKVVLYRPGRLLPEETMKQKYHISGSVGVIHILADNDYLGIVKYLMTPAEIHDYFRFRELHINKWGSKLKDVPEPALLGQYLIGDEESPPNIEFMSSLVALNQDIDKWDMTRVIKTFPEKMQNYESSKDYYFIVREMAKLMRNDLRFFKERFKLSMENAKENKFYLPYRFAVPRTNCGFLFIPLEKEFEPNKKKALTNLALAHKYELKLQRCIAATFIYQGNGYYDVDWCFIDHQWKQNEETERLLKDNYPFRKVHEKVVERYEFNSN